MARKHKEDEVLRDLYKKHDVQVSKNEIYVLTGDGRQNDLGNGTWGKIDFLVNHRGYRLIRTKRF